MLEKIVKDYIEDFRVKTCDSELKSYIVPNSIPIIWFGNMDNYMKSERRIVTIGLNPSLNEFSEPRFQEICFDDEVDSKKVESLKQTLDSYFDNNPYTRWFCRGERVLNDSFDATYYTEKATDKGLNQAIHIDVYTAIATDPTWGDLDNDVRNKLRNTGLFNTLLDYLNPDIILVSTNRPVFDEVFGDFIFEGERYQNSDRPSTFYVRKYRKGSQVLLFWFFNNRGMAFGPRFDFVANSIKDLE